jgi:hypothetical protein
LNMLDMVRRWVDSTRLMTRELSQQLAVTGQGGKSSAAHGQVAADIDTESEQTLEFSRKTIERRRVVAPVVELDPEVDVAVRTCFTPGHAAEHNDGARAV